MIAHRVELREIEGMRDIYRHEMNCQIIHDSIHARPGWTHEYLLMEGAAKVGYGSIAVAGPWEGKPTVCEYFVLPQHRSRYFRLLHCVAHEQWGDRDRDAEQWCAAPGHAAHVRSHGDERVDSLS